MAKVVGGCQALVDAGILDEQGNVVGGSGTGPQGPEGKAATIRVGSVTSGDSVSVTNSGTENAAVFDFVLKTGPKGEKGDKGDTGAQGPAGATPSNATTSQAGIVKQIEAISDLSGAPSQEDFNGLLAKMRTAGILAGS